MAIKTTKKPATKLKAGKKKPLNKWLILAGVAAVAAIGIAVVRFSSAATVRWYSISREDVGYIDLTGSRSKINSQPATLKAGKTYRFCVRGGSRGYGASTTTIELSFKVEKPSAREGVALSTKQFKPHGDFHCSGEFYASKDHVVRGTTKLKRGGNFRIDATSIDERRFY